MPPKETDGAWHFGSAGRLYITASDGTVTPIDEIPVYEPEEILTPEQAAMYDFDPSELFKEQTFTATIRLPHKVQIAMARASRRIIKALKRFNNQMRRIDRTMKRLKEKERRRRLKEEHANADHA